MNNAFHVFASLYLSFLLFHFALYFMFWLTGTGKFLAMIKE